MIVQVQYIQGRSKVSSLTMCQSHRWFLERCVEIIQSMIVRALTLFKDYPYGIGFWDVNANIDGLSTADFLSIEEKDGVFSANTKTLWGGKLKYI